MSETSRPPRSARVDPSDGAERPPEDASTAERDLIFDTLRRFYEGVEREPVPDRLRDLLDRLAGEDPDPPR